MCVCFHNTCFCFLGGYVGKFWKLGLNLCAATTLKSDKYFSQFGVFFNKTKNRQVIGLERQKGCTYSLI